MARRPDDARRKIHGASIGAKNGGRSHKPPCAGSALGSSSYMGVEVSRLSNGLTVATETLSHIESVALGVWVKSGSRNEREDEHGIAHLLEHMAFKGTERRTAWN
ncbi:insulinase family protein, partial [Rhizobiaceae sp. 2RAB30]